MEAAGTGGRIAGRIHHGVRCVLAGMAGMGLALTNLPLLVVSVLALALAPVPFLGLALVPWTMTLVRKRTDLERRRASRTGVLVTRPYRPVPDRAGVWQRFRWTVTDPATWRDLAWLVPGAIVGFALGLIGVLVPLYGIAGLTLVPLWIWLGTGWYGYGVIWSIDTWPAGLRCLPQGAVILAAGLWAAPWLRWLDAHFARLFLAPTKAAELRLRVTQLTVTRADTVDAQAAELRRIERDLHDGAQARLVSLSMTIGLADTLIDRDPAEAHKLLAEARESSGTALVELRHLVRGIHPPVLAERGLGGAVRALALSLPVPITVDIDLPGAARHARGVRGLLRRRRDPDQHDPAQPRPHRIGVHALRRRSTGRGGQRRRCRRRRPGQRHRPARYRAPPRRVRWHDHVLQPAGGPTVITMEVPCALSSPRTMPSSGTD